MPRPTHRARHLKTSRTSTHSSRPVGISAALLNVFFWGLAPAIIKSGLDIVSPQVFLYYRFLIVIALTTPFLFLFRKKFASVKSPTQLASLLGIGFLTNPLSLGLLFFGLQLTTSSAAAIIAAIAPLFIILLSAIFLREKITKFELIGALVATAGTFLIILETPEQAHATNPLLGNMFVLGSDVVWAVGVLLMKKLAQKHNPFIFGYTGWLTGMVAFGLMTLLTEPVMFLRPLIITQLQVAFWPILYMAVFGSIIAFTAYQVAQKHLLASEVSIFTYLQPIVTIPLSVLWLHEKLGVLFSVGCVLLAIGVMVAEIHTKSRVKGLVSRLRKNN